MQETTTEAKTTATPRILLFLIIMLGFFLRVWRLDYFPLRGDEGFTMVIWLNSVRDILGSMAGVEPHPPFAVLSIFSWVQMVGDSEFSARFLSVLASTLSTALVYSLGMLVSSRKAGLTAAFLWAINPYQVWFAQDLRSNALWIALSLSSVWFMIRALRTPGKVWVWVLYVLTSALALYTFYLELFVLAVQNLIALGVIVRTRSRLRPWLFAQISLGMLLAPWFLQPRLYSGGYAPTGGPVNIPWAFQELLFGKTLPPPFQASAQDVSEGGWAVFIAVALIGLGMVFGWLRRRQVKVSFLVMYALLPLLMLSAVEWVLGSGYFRPRYVASSTPAWILLLSVGITMPGVLVKNQWYAKLISGFLFISVLLLNLLGLQKYYFDPAFAKSVTWREMAEALESRVDVEHDLIVRNYPDPTFYYYYHGNANVVLSPEDPAIHPQPRLEELRHLYSYFWFMPQPGTPWSPDNATITWFEQEMLLVTDQLAGNIRIQQYADYVAQKQDITFPMDVTFADFAALAGYRVTPNQQAFSPGDRITIELFWVPKGTSDVPLTVFLHLLGPLNADGNPLWAGHDHPPQNGRVSTDSWADGDILRDVFVLDIPLDAPPAEYKVATGFYNPQTGGRILDIQGEYALAMEGAASLFTITVSP